MAVDDLATHGTKSSITMPLTKLNWNKLSLFSKGHAYISYHTNHENYIFDIQSKVYFHVEWQNILN